jgi:AraC family transcriptional activator of pobA
VYEKSKLVRHSFEFRKQTNGLVVTFSACLAHDIFRDTSKLADALHQPSAAQFSRAELAAGDIEQLAAMLMRESSQYATGRDSALRGLLTTLLTNVLRISERAVTLPPSIANRDRELVAQFRQIVERRYRGHLDVCAYASEIGTTEAALRRACRRVAGQSPTQLVQARMLIEAERQLRYTGMSIRQIGYYLGFEDPAYFSRFFAKSKGSSPRNFRRSMGTAPLIRSDLRARPGRVRASRRRWTRPGLLSTADTPSAPTRWPQTASATVRTSPCGLHRHRRLPRRVWRVGYRTFTNA